jgi:hypothetical protein
VTENQLLQGERYADQDLNKKEFKTEGSRRKYQVGKDDFGRFYAVVTHGDGCGKPVIYLYPPEPKRVRVRLHSSIRIAESIPVYSRGWEVFATPNGKIIDLKPELTDCSSFPTGHAGQEYAQSACNGNAYPYLYWSGAVQSRYPKPRQGWVVPSGELDGFLRTKLAMAGLSGNESDDMLEYWLSRMMARKAPFYRVSFLFTPQLNRLFRMTVLPRPQTVIRVFLDWEPLLTPPQTPMEPQEIPIPPVRTGFTVVEWGGLKYPGEKGSMNRL